MSNRRASIKPKPSTHVEQVTPKPKITHLPRWPFVALVGTVLTVLLAHPIFWGARYIMIGWDTCSRNGPAPMLVECIPGISDPEVWNECTGRELGYALMEARDWRTRKQDCRTPHIFSGFMQNGSEQDPAPAPAPAETEEDTTE